MHDHAHPFSSLLDTLNKPHIVYTDIQPLMKALLDYENILMRQVGASYNGQAINLISIGNGPIVIFAWTQMHGDEATATAAVFDWINILLHNNHKKHALNDFSLSEWESHFTLHILPMLNPDGAQACTRENAQGIDINRDAFALQTPEANILTTLCKQLEPDIAFNLHDQSSDYRCGHTDKHSTIAFLAPPFDKHESVDNSRKRAMQIIASMHKALQAYIPYCIARYEAEFSSLCFGDTIAAKQVSTILIESGAAENDPNRQVARQMNVVALLSAMQYLLDEKNGLFSASTTQDYFNIPPNTLAT